MSIFHCIRAGATKTMASLALATALAATPSAALDLNQGAFIPATTTYEFGYNSIPAIPVVGAPHDADWDRWAMLHDGSVYRLYAFRHQSVDTIYQFGFNRSTNAYEYGYESIPVLRVVGFPQDTDWDRWAMLHDGTDYRFYAFRRGSGTQVYQAGYDPRVQEYIFGHRSIEMLTMRGFPSNSNRRSMAILHDGRDYRFYFKNQ